MVRAVGGEITAGDQTTIERNIVEDVLEAKRYPEIRFRSTRIAGLHVEGTLSLHGRERPIAFDVREEGDRRIAEVRLHQPDFGIKPYRAMLGTLRIRPDVLVRVSARREG